MNISSTEIFSPFTVCVVPMQGDKIHGIFSEQRQPNSPDHVGDNAEHQGKQSLLKETSHRQWQQKDIKGCYLLLKITPTSPIENLCNEGEIFHADMQQNSTGDKTYTLRGILRNGMRALMTMFNYST